MAAAETESGGVVEYRNLFGARVHFPIDMPDAMLKHAIESARRNIAACDDWQAKGDETVRKIKAEFDEAYGPSWHVFVGKHFGSKVTHDSKAFAFFYLEDKAVLIFKCG